MPAIVTCHRPPKRRSSLFDWLCAAPGLMLLGAMIGHLIEAATR